MKKIRNHCMRNETSVTLLPGIGGESGAPVWLNVQLKGVEVPVGGIDSLHPLPQLGVPVEEVRPGHVHWGVGLHAA